tara:strand:- start:1234 stop:1341 length:108 start_codon:yes stop_codon:yes gene_type:complete
LIKQEYKQKKYKSFHIANIKKALQIQGFSFTDRKQ